MTGACTAGPCAAGHSATEGCYFDGIRCGTCRLPVDPEAPDTHTPHEPDCPRLEDPDEDCTCTAYAHPGCCPECHPRVP
jgi:hypothetical protein